jgi:large subunit ribosomal protein L24
MPPFLFSQVRFFKPVKFRNLIGNWKISVGDKVKINSGKADGCVGRVLAADKERNVVKVQNCNLYTKRGPDGKYRLVPRAVHYSNVNLVDPVTNEPTRVTVKEMDGGEFQRISKKSGTLIPWPRKDVSPTRVKPHATTGPKDTPVEFALQKTYSYHEEVEAMKQIRQSLTKYNQSV